MTAAGANGYGTVNNYGTLTVVGGTYTNPKESDASNFFNRSGGTATFENVTINGGGGCIATQVDTTTTINGGHYEDSTYPAIENRGKMLITGGTFINTSCSSCDGRWGYTIRSGESSDTAYLKIQGETEDSVQVIGVQGGLAVVGGTADIYNGNYKTEPCKVHTTGSSAFYAGYFTGESYKTATTIYGGSFISCSKTAVLVGNGNPAPDSGAGEESTVMIKGGTFVGGDAAKTAITVNKTDYAVGAANITGGTFSSNVEEYISEDYETVKRGDQWVVGTLDELAVAEANGTKYTTLAKAIENINNEGTIVLLQDVEENVTIAATQEITLDLNGYVLNGGKVSGQAALTNYGTVIIQDSSSNGTGAIKRDENGETTAYYVLDNHGTMTINSGTIYNNSGNNQNGASLIRNVGSASDTATLTINGGKLQQDNFIVVKNDDYGKLVVNGGEIVSENNQAIQNWNEAEIKGGLMTGKVITWSYVVIPNNAKMEITGGKIDGDVGSINYYSNDSYGTAPEVKISGNACVTGNLGTYVYNNGVQTPVKDEQAKIAVTGGHFGNPVDDYYLDDSLNAELKSASNPEAPYSYYTSMNDAIAAAKPGDVVSPVDSTATTYTVTLNYNDGQTASQSYTEAEGSFIALPTPTRSGYTFQGWYTGSNKVSSPYQVTGNVTLVAQWSKDYVPPVDGGDTAPSGEYIVFVETDGNGRVILSPSRADKGDTVSITVKPDKGYDLDELTVTDNKGKTIKLTSKGDNQYTFEMPGSEVTVEASFVSNGEPVSDLPFYDVSENDWFYDAVVYAYENELMSGTSAHTFAPNSQMTRAMIWTVLAAYEGENTSGGATWYEAGQKWAMDNGISDGTNPNGAITREQLAVMLWRYAGSPKAEMSLASYTDASAVSSWAVDAMAWAVDNGLISGMGNGILAPQGNATRAQVATIMMQFAEKI